MNSPTIFDRSVKILIRDNPTTLCRLLHLQVQPEQVRTDDVSVNVTEFRSDQLLIIEGDGPPAKWGLQGEFQIEPDKRPVQGWFLKNAALNHQKDFPVVLVVIYLSRGNRRRFPSSYTIKAKNITNEYRFHTIRLWEHIDRIRYGDLQVLAPLLVLCEDHPTEATLREERDIIYGLDVEEQQRTELLALSLMVGRRYFAEELPYAIFQEELPMLKGLSFVQEWLDDSRAEGEASGEARGEARGARRMALRLLRERFGELPDSVVVRVESADAAWCENLAAQALTARSLGELM